MKILVFLLARCKLSKMYRSVYSFFAEVINMDMSSFVAKMLSKLYRRKSQGVV